MLVNEYKPEFQFRKSSKVDAKFGQCLHLGPPLLRAEPMRRTDLTASLKVRNFSYTCRFTLCRFLGFIILY